MRSPYQGAQKWQKESNLKCQASVRNNPVPPCFLACGYLASMIKVLNGSCEQRGLLA